MTNQLTISLEHYMDLLSTRQKLVSSNIANADTPGYKTQDIDFQTEFAAQVAGSTPHTVQVAGLAAKNDGNNVNLDREAKLLAENALRFNIASNLMRAQLQQLKSAIREGKNS